jgi:ketosteroid isomerase-like protein
MQQENIETVRSAYEHLNRSDAEGLVALCDADFVMDMSERVFNPDTYRGQDGIRRFLAGVNEVWESYRWEIEEMVVEQEVVVAMLHCRGQGREGGPEVDWHVAWLWRFRQGTPVSLRFYRDPARALEAASPSG